MDLEDKPKDLEGTSVSASTSGVVPVKSSESILSSGEENATGSRAKNSDDTSDTDVDVCTVDPVPVVLQPEGDSAVKRKKCEIEGVVQVKEPAKDSLGGGDIGGFTSDTGGSTSDTGGSASEVGGSSSGTGGTDGSSASTVAFTSKAVGFVTSKGGSISAACGTGGTIGATGGAIGVRGGAAGEIEQEFKDAERAFANSEIFSRLEAIVTARGLTSARTFPSQGQRLSERLSESTRAREIAEEYARLYGRGFIGYEVASRGIRSAQQSIQGAFVLRPYRDLIRTCSTLAQSTTTSPFGAGIRRGRPPFLSAAEEFLHSESQNHPVSPNGGYPQSLRTSNTFTTSSTNRPIAHLTQSQTAVLRRPAPTATPAVTTVAATATTRSTSTSRSRLFEVIGTNTSAATRCSAVPRGSLQLMSTEMAARLVRTCTSLPPDTLGIVPSVTSTEELQANPNLVPVPDEEPVRITQGGVSYTYYHAWDEVTNRRYLVPQWALVGRGSRGSMIGVHTDERGRSPEHNMDFPQFDNAMVERASSQTWSADTPFFPQSEDIPVQDISTDSSELIDEVDDLPDEPEIAGAATPSDSRSRSREKVASCSRVPGTPTRRSQARGTPSRRARTTPAVSPRTRKTSTTAKLVGTASGVSPGAHISSPTSDSGTISTPHAGVKTTPSTPAKPNMHRLPSASPSSPATTTTNVSPGSSTSSKAESFSQETVFVSPRDPPSTPSKTRRLSTLPSTSLAAPSTPPLGESRRPCTPPDARIPRVVPSAPRYRCRTSSPPDRVRRLRSPATQLVRSESARQLHSNVTSAHSLTPASPTGVARTRFVMRVPRTEGSTVTRPFICLRPPGLPVEPYVPPVTTVALSQPTVSTSRSSTVRPSWDSDDFSSRRYPWLSRIRNDDDPLVSTRELLSFCGRNGMRHRTNRSRAELLYDLQSMYDNNEPVVPSRRRGMAQRRASELQPGVLWQEREPRSTAPQPSAAAPESRAPELEPRAAEPEPRIVEREPRVAEPEAETRDTVSVRDTVPSPVMRELEDLGIWAVLDAQAEAREREGEGDDSDQNED